METASKLDGVVEGEAGGEESSLVKEPDKVLDGLVRGISVSLLAEGTDDAAVRVDLHGLLGGHVAHGGAVAEGLGLHDTLHVSGPTVLTSGEGARGVNHAVGDDDLLNLVIEHRLDELGELSGLGLLLLEVLLLLVVKAEVKTLLGDRDELLAVELLELLNGVLIDGVDHEEALVALLAETLEEGRVLDGLAGLTGDVEDTLLLLRHAGDVVLQGGHLLARLGGRVAKELSELLAVLGVLVYTELEVLGEGLVELGVLAISGVILSKLSEELEALLDEVLADNLEHTVLLKGLTGDVKGKILRVNNTADEAEPLGHEVLAVVHDEDTANVELDLVLLLGVATLEHVEGSTLGHEEESAELEVTLDGEVLGGKGSLPVVGDALVEGIVLLGGDIIGLTHPDGLLVVEELPLRGDLLDLLGLLLLLAVFLLVGHVLDLGGITLLFLFLLFVVGDLLLGLLLNQEVDGEADELGVLLDEVLDAALLKVLLLVVLKVENDVGTAGDTLVLGVLSHGERATSGGRPNPLLVVVVGLGVDLDAVSNKVSGVEADTELTNHRDISTSLESLHEGLGAGLGDGTEVGHEILLGHTNTGIADGEGLVGLVGDDLDLHLLAGLEDLGVCDGGEADLIESITGVGDELTKEDLLGRVEGVDDQRKKLADISRERECLGVAHCACWVGCTKNSL